MGDCLYLHQSFHLYRNFTYNNHKWESLYNSSHIRPILELEPQLWVITRITPKMFEIQPASYQIDENTFYKGTFCSNNVEPYRNSILGRSGHHTLHVVKYDPKETDISKTRKIHKFTWKPQMWERYCPKKFYLYLRWNSNYTGDIVDNIAEGEGKFIFHPDSYESIQNRLTFYEGQFQNNTSYGLGIIGHKKPYNSSNKFISRIIVLDSSSSVPDTRCVSLIHLFTAGTFLEQYRLYRKQYQIHIYDEGYFMERNIRVSKIYSILWVPLTQSYHLLDSRKNHDFLDPQHYPENYQTIINEIISSRNPELLTRLQPYKTHIPDFFKTL